MKIIFNKIIWPKKLLGFFNAPKSYFWKEWKENKKHLQNMLWNGCMQDCQVSGPRMSLLSSESILQCHLCTTSVWFLLIFCPCRDAMPCLDNHRQGGLLPWKAWSCVELLGYWGRQRRHSKLSNLRKFLSPAQLQTTKWYINQVEIVMVIGTLRSKHPPHTGGFPQDSLYWCQFPAFP